MTVNGYICRCGTRAPGENSKVKDSLCEENQCPGDTNNWCGGTDYIRVFHVHTGNISILFPSANV